MVLAEEVFPAVEAALAAAAREGGGKMKAGEFLSRVANERIVEAINRAEQKTSGEIRVFVSRQATSDPVETGMRHFKRLNMEATKERNGVLIFVAPVSQNFAVIGDKAIHETCGQEFWTRMAGVITDHFKKKDFTGGLVTVIEEAGNLLARHFPRRPDDTNELSNEVAQD